MSDEKMRRIIRDFKRRMQKLVDEGSIDSISMKVGNEKEVVIAEKRPPKVKP